MPKLLYVIAHPGTAEKSLTLKVSDTFINAWEQNNPEGTVDVVNLFEQEPPYYTQGSFRHNCKGEIQYHHRSRTNIGGD